MCRLRSCAHRCCALGALAIVTLAGCAQVNAIVLQKPDATRLTGDWEGVYPCGQGPTSATLSITGTPNGQVTGVLDFHPVSENPQIPSGRYTVRGSFTVEGDLTLVPDAWIVRPRNSHMVGLRGKVDILNIAFQGTVPECRKPFKLSKGRSQPTIAAEPPQAQPTQSLPAPVAQPAPTAVSPKPIPTGHGAVAEAATPSVASPSKDITQKTTLPAESGHHRAAQETETRQPEAKTDRLPPEDPDLAREFKGRHLVFGHAITPQDKENAKLPEPSQGKPGEVETALAKYDLNGDGVPDYVKWHNVVGPRGEEDASYEVLLSGASGFAQAMRFEASRAGMELAAIDIDRGSANGARDLVIFSNYGDTHGVVLLHFAFDGQRYAVADVSRLLGGKSSSKTALKPVDKESFAKGSVGGESFFLAEPNPGSPSIGSVVKGTSIWIVGEVSGKNVLFVGARHGYSGFMPKDQIVAKNPVTRSAKAKATPKRASTAAQNVKSPLCREGERTYLRCKLNGRKDEAAFCGSPEPVGTASWVAFRFGTPGAVRVEYPERGVPPRAAFFWYAGESTATGPYYDVWFKHGKQVVSLRWYGEGNAIQGSPELSIGSLGVQTGQSLEGSCEGADADSNLFPTRRREWAGF